VSLEAFHLFYSMEIDRFYFWFFIYLKEKLTFSLSSIKFVHTTKIKLIFKPNYLKANLKQNAQTGFKSKTYHFLLLYSFKLMEYAF